MKQPCLRLRVEVKEITFGFISYEIRHKAKIVAIGTHRSIENVGKEVVKYMKENISNEQNDNT